MRPKGFRLSEESKGKISRTILSQYRDGRISHNKGKSKADYNPLKIVSSNMIDNKNCPGYSGKLNPMFGRKNPHLKKLNKLRIGGKHTDETKRKISIRSKASWLKTRAKRIRSLKKVWCKHQRMTYLEIKFQDICKKHDLPFRYVGNGKLWITSFGTHMNPDFVSTDGSRILVEVYAKCWKSSDYEELRGRLLKSAGFSTIFLSNDILDSQDWEHQCLNKIRLQE